MLYIEEKEVMVNHGIEVLVEFLRRYCALESFELNCGSDIHDRMLYVFEMFNAELYGWLPHMIKAAFFWELTSEGYDYWDNLHKNFVFELLAGPEDKQFIDILHRYTYIDMIDNYNNKQGYNTCTKANHMKESI